jgi:hypothetical protein
MAVIPEPVPAGIQRLHDPARGSARRGDRPQRGSIPAVQADEQDPLAGPAGIFVPISWVVGQLPPLRLIGDIHHKQTSLEQPLAGILAAHQIPPVRHGHERDPRSIRRPGGGRDGEERGGQRLALPGAGGEQVEPLVGPRAPISSHHHRDAIPACGRGREEILISQHGFHRQRAGGPSSRREETQGNAIRED